MHQLRLHRNLTKNILQTVKRQTTTALPCGSPPTDAAHMISDVRYYYDEAGSVDTEPVYGQVSKTETLRDWTPGGGTSWQRASETTRFDAFGRPLITVDARGNTTTTSYTPASGGPLTRTTSTLGTPFNWTTTTDVNPYWGSTVKITDPNGRVADVEYDPLGRVWKVWQVGWSKAANPTKPSVEYTYTLSPDRSAYPYVTTKTLHAGGGYLTSYQILDRLLRPRQTQSAAVGGGRIVTDTLQALSLMNWPQRKGSEYGRYERARLASKMRLPRVASVFGRSLTTASFRLFRSSRPSSTPWLLEVHLCAAPVRSPFVAGWSKRSITLLDTTSPNADAGLTSMRALMRSLMREYPLNEGELHSMVGEPTNIDDVFQQVRRKQPGDRRAWLRLHAPREGRAHWWWALLECAQAAVARSAGALTSDYAANVFLAVDLVAVAEADGMPAYLCAGWTARIARSAQIDGNDDVICSAGLDPDSVAQRILAAFQLSPTAALSAAARERQELLTNDDAWVRPGEVIAATESGGPKLGRLQEDAELARLQKIKYLMPDLALVASQITDSDLAERVRSWLALRDRLDVGDEVAQHGRELLARWREESSGAAERCRDGVDE